MNTDNCAIMHKMRWDDLQFVLAVAEHGSLSAAGRALGVNHATVLRRITAFEDRYGVSLFERPPGGYRLKPGGQEILSTIRMIDRSVERLERSFTALGRDIEGSFRLTTTDTIAKFVIPIHLRSLGALYPSLRVDLAVSNIHLNMTRPDAEFTIRPALSLPSDLTGRRACDMHFQVYGSIDYLAGNDSANPADHHWLGVAPPLTRSPVGNWQDEKIGDNFAVRADSFLTLAAAAEVGLGLAMLPTFAARRSPALKRAQMFPDTLTTGIWVASHPDLLRYDQVRFLVDFFADAIAADAAQLQ